MEGKQFKVVFDHDENGKPVRRFVPADDPGKEPEYAVYGDYRLLKEHENIQNTKEELLQGLFDVIRELSGKDEFWIVNTVMGQTAVGWKIHFPHMDEV